jgi:uncharacterized protein (TIGR02444 family)
MKADVHSDDFWGFATSFYANPAVEAQCLTLQDKQGVDVVTLLFFIWLGLEQGQLTDIAIRTIASRCGLWSDHLVKPLRSSRRWMKEEQSLRSADPEGFDNLREAIKQDEILAEKLLAKGLVSFWQSLSTPIIRATPGPDAAKANCTLYFHFLGGESSTALAGAVEVLIAETE